MDIGQIITDLLKVRGYTKEYFSKKMGFRYSSGVTEQIRRKSGITLRILLRFLEQLDCELVVRSKADRRAEWIVELGEDEKE